MPSTKSYLDYVLNQISDLKDISFRPMMGEYIIYYHQKVVGGIYDDRLLLKPTKSALRILDSTGIQRQMELPYEGAKEMLVADIDDSESICQLIRAIAEDLPMPKQKNK